MEARSAAEPLTRSGLPVWLLGVVPLLLIVALVGLFAALGAPGLGDRNGVPVEALAVERTVLRPGVIELTVRNDGPDAVTIAQAQVNDAFVAFSGAAGPIERLRSATVRLQQPWLEGESYEVVLLTSTGGTDRPLDRRCRRDAGGRPQLLRSDGAARALRRRDPGGARNAVASVGAPHPSRRGCARSWR